MDNKNLRGVIISNLETNTDKDIETPCSTGKKTIIWRQSQELVSQISQVSLYQINSGVIKAFFLHKQRDMIWFVLGGRIMLVLYDCRKLSETANQIQVLYASRGNDQNILIPAGIVYGYKVVSGEPALINVLTTGEDSELTSEQIFNPAETPLFDFKWEQKPAPKQKYTPL